MGLTIEWTTRAIRDMRRLVPEDRERIIANVEQYAGDPESLARQVTRLTGSDYSRLRVGGHRVIFLGEHDEAELVVVLKVRHRRDSPQERSV